MTEDQEQQVATALTQIAYSLEYLTRFASVLCTKFGVPQPQPPDPRDSQGKGVCAPH